MRRSAGQLLGNLTFLWPVLSNNPPTGNQLEPQRSNTRRNQGLQITYFHPQRFFIDFVVKAAATNDFDSDKQIMDNFLCKMNSVVF